MSSTQKIMPRKKGMIPRNVSAMGTSEAMLDMAKTFNPMGGVIMPISIMITVITPNHTPSMPMAWMEGHSDGRVSSIMGTMFMTQPRKTYSTITRASST